MDLLRRFPFLAYVLALLSMFGFTWASHNYPLMAFAFLATALSWWLVESSEGPPIPRWIITSAVLVDALMLACELILFHQQNLILALGHFIVGLILCKLYEVKTNRDYGQILILTLLLMLSAAILTTSAIFAVTLVCYLGMGLYVSLVFHLRCETQRAMLQHAASDRAMLMNGQNPVMARDIRRIFWGSAVTLFIFACLVFVLFPRTDMPGILAKWRIHGPQTETGFTNHVRLGKHGRLEQSNAIVAEIRLSMNGKNIGSNSYQPYFCGSTLNVYDARTHEWVRSTSSRRRRHPYQIHGDHRILFVHSGPGTYPKSALVRQDIRLNRINGNTNLFAMTPAVSFLSPDVETLLRLSNGMLMCSAPRVQHIHYIVESPRRYNPRILGTRMPELFPKFIMYEPYNPESFEQIRSSPIPSVVSKMAHKIAAGLLLRRRTSADHSSIDLKIAQSFCTYLQTHYRYSFNMSPVNPSIDPTVDFLLNKQKVGGYCEYFASAMIMFCRSVGIPARMVTGYHGGDYNGIAKYYIVRQKFAHAWVQVFIPAHGWYTFDPSPSTSLTSVQTPQTWYSGISEFFQWIRIKWLQNIVAFNAIMRNEIIHSVAYAFKSFLMAGLDELHAAIMHLRSWLFQKRTGWFSKIAAGAIALLSALFIGWFARRRHYNKTSVLPKVLQGLDAKSHRQLSRDLAFFDRLLRLLQKTGNLKTSAQTPLEYVTQLIHSRGDIAPEALDLINIFYELRFGTMVMTPNRRASINQYLKMIEDNLRKKHGKYI